MAGIPDRSERGTYFKQFWDPSSRVPLPAKREELNDIQTPIHKWRADVLGAPGHSLGTHLVTGGTGFVVLLIRGAAPAFPSRGHLSPSRQRETGKPRTPDSSAKPVLPEFRALIHPDVTFLGFRVDAATAKGHPGSFFVIEQPPMEPRFGLDEPDLKPLGGNWSNLDWGDVRKTEKDYIQLTGGLKVSGGPADPPVWGMGSTAAQIAEITMQNGGENRPSREQRPAMTPQELRDAWKKNREDLGQLQSAWQAQHLELERLAADEPVQSAAASTAAAALQATRQILVEVRRLLAERAR